MEKKTTKSKLGRKPGHANKETKILLNGCKYYHDCFTCPYDDCIVGVDLSNPNKAKADKEAMNKKIKVKSIDN